MYLNPKLLVHLNKWCKR